jgi:photoactive yellow protein
MTYLKTLPPPYEEVDRHVLVAKLREEVSELQRLLQIERQETQHLRADVVRLMREMDALRPASTPPPISAPASRTVRDVSPASLDDPPRAAFEPPRLRAAPTVAGGVTGMASADQGLDFGAVARLTPEQLDGLPFGLVTLDAEGRILHYNDTEARMVGLSRERVLGKNFFTQVAPCTRVREFEGRFRQLALDPARVRVQTFDFVFRFAKGEQLVTIVMTPGRVRGQFHLAMVRRPA